MSLMNAFKGGDISTIMKKVLAVVLLFFLIPETIPLVIDGLEKIFNLSIIYPNLPLIGIFDPNSGLMGLVIVFALVGVVLFALIGGKKN